MPRISYKELLRKSNTWYKTIKKVYCSCLRENIIFNSKGFYHLKYDGLGKARSKKERMYKLGLLPLVIPVIKCARKIHKYTPPKYSKWVGKYVEYWALKEIVGKQKTTITVILRRIGTGNITFHSIMKKRDKKSKKPRN